MVDWKPIMDALPDNDREVLCMLKDYPDPVMGYFLDGKWITDIPNAEVISWCETPPRYKEKGLSFRSAWEAYHIASKIKANEPVVEINGVLVENKAKIVELRSFSSHASYEELMDYYTEIPYNKICLVHGEMNGKVEFAKTLKGKLASNGKSARVIAVNADTKIYI